MKEIEMYVGSVVRLKSGGPRMTVAHIAAVSEQKTPECVRCGPYPLGAKASPHFSPAPAVVDTAAVDAAICQAQQLWRTRHEQHGRSCSNGMVTCVWFARQERHEGEFAYEMLEPAEHGVDDELEMAPVRRRKAYEP